MALYHTVSHGPDREALKYGLKALIEIAIMKNHVGYIATHVKGNVQDGFSDTFGWKPIQKFLKSGHIHYDEVDIYLQTERKHPSIYIAGPVLSPYNSLHFTIGLLDEPKNTDLVYVPWMENELQNYLEKYPESVEIYRA